MSQRIFRAVAATLFVTLVAVSQGFAQQKSPTETLAPLIGEKTLVIAQVNLDAIDFDKVRQLALTGAEQYVMLQNFDRESVDDVLDEAGKLLDSKLPMVEAAFEQFLEESGLRQVYFVSYYDLIEQMPGFLAIPTAGLTSAHREFLEEKTDDGMGPFVLEWNGFLIVPVTNSYALDEDELTEYLDALEPIEVPAFDEAFADTDSALLRVAVAVPDNVGEILAEAGVPMIPIPQVGTLLHLIDDHTRWANLVIDIAKPELRAAIQMSSNDSAVEVRETLFELIDMGVAMWLMQMEQEDGEAAEFMPLIGAYLRGMIRSALPIVDGDQLVYVTSGENGAAAAVGVGGVAVALLLPAVQAAREAARRMQCTNNLKQIGLAMHNYHDAQRSLPPAYTVDKNGKPLHSWRVLILPYMEQAALYDEIRLDEPWDSEHNSQFHDLVIPVFQCPSNGNVELGANCCYTVVLGEDTVFPGAKALTFASITDGMSNTAMLAERLEPVCWMDPTRELTLEAILEQGGINEDYEGTGSYHTGGINVLLCDGSVHFLSEYMDLEPLENLFNRNDGSEIDDNDF